MHIIETTFWKTPRAALIVLKACLDPTPIITNAKMYALYNKKELISICAIEKRNNNLELSSVVTKKQYRGKGYATKLLRHVLKKYASLYLVSIPELEHFYKRFGFRKTAIAPASIYRKVAFVNFFRRLFFQQPIIVMKRAK